MEDSNEYRYVMYLKSELDQKLFPNDFDIWTVQEQCAWINKNLATLFPNVPKSLLNLIPASFRSDSGQSPVEVPEWLDIDKYRRGRKFVRKNYTSVIFAEILGVMNIYTFKEILNPLIMSNRSYTPYLAWKRKMLIQHKIQNRNMRYLKDVKKISYLLILDFVLYGFQRKAKSIPAVSLFPNYRMYISTITRFDNWCNGEPWIEGTQAYKDMQFTRKVHAMVGASMSKMDNEQIDNQSKIVNPWCTDRESLLKDFAAACPPEKDRQRPYITIYKSQYKLKAVTNTDIANIQCSIISFILLCPETVGLHGAIDDDIEAFCHMWKCYGYYLGIEDKHNFCRGSLEEIKQRARDTYRYSVLHNFKDVTPEWEHMTKCFTEVINIYPLLYLPHKVLMLMASDVLNINMPHLYASMSWTEWTSYKVWRFIFHHFLKLRIMQNGVKVTRMMINYLTNLSPEQDAELQKRSEKFLSITH